MLDRRLIDAEALRGFYDEIEPGLYRFPAISPERFRARVEQFTAERGA